jgi:integrase
MARVHKQKVFEIAGWWLDRVPGSEFWYAFHYDGERGAVRRQSLGVVNLEDAKEKLARLALLKAPKTTDSFLTLILDNYFREVSDAKASGPQARFAAAHLLAFWGDTSRVSEVTERKQHEFLQWCRGKGLSVGYTARMMTVLSAAVRHGLKKDAPKVITWPGTIAAILDVAEPLPREWIPTNKELASFLDSLEGDRSEHVFRYCLLALNTLARPAAILDLCPGQIDIERGLISLNPEERRQTKKHRPIVRLPDTLAPWINAWNDDDPERYVQYRGKRVKSVKHTFKRHGKELGLPEFTPYTLRHKMATELRARGVIGEEVSYQIGHKRPDMRTTGRYLKFDPRYLSNAKVVIEEYIRDLNKLTKRDLLAPDTLKILSNDPSHLDSENDKFPFGIKVVGGAGIEPAAPTMSR